MRHVGSIALLACLLGSALAAQRNRDVYRGKILGLVTGEKGDPVEGAEVVVLSRPVPSRWDIGEQDLLRTRTDARGRFRVMGLRGRGYTAWATHAKDKGARVSAAVEDVIPGPPVMLRLARPRTPGSVRVEGAKTWRGVRFFATTLTKNVHRIELKQEPDGSLRLPSLPGDVHVTAHDARGVVLGRATMGVLRVQPPSKVTINVVSAATAKPLAGADVFFTPYDGMGTAAYHLLPTDQTRTPYYTHDGHLPPTLVGTTGANGQCRITVPRGHVNPRANVDPTVRTRDRQFYLEAKGCVRTLLPQRFEAKTTTIILHRGSIVKGRILDERGRPVAGFTLLPEFYAHGLARVGTAAISVHPRTLTTDKDGRFTFHGVHPSSGFRLMAIVSHQRADELGMRCDPGYPLAPLICLADEKMKARDLLDLGDIRLDRIQIARLEVRRFNDNPASRALLVVRSSLPYGQPLQYVVDGVGRIQFTVPAGTIHIGAFERGGGIATTNVGAPRTPVERQPDPVRLELSQPVRVTGIVVAKNGRTLAGAILKPRYRLDGSDWHRKITAYLSYGQVVSDESGKFTLQLPYRGPTYRVRGSWKRGKRELHSEDIPIPADAQKIESVRIVIGTGPY